MRKRGRSERDAARGVRLWHTGPSRFRTYLTAGADTAAWARIDAKVTGRIDHHLANAGIA